MSTLSMQADELREAAKHLEEIGLSVGHDGTASAFLTHDAVERMRRAADTIEGLRGRLQKEGDVLRDYRASQIAAEAERRLQGSCGQVPELGKRENGGERESCGTRWHELFGTPERAARTIADACTTDPGDGCIGCPAFGAKCGCGGYDALLEWLREDCVHHD